MFFPESLYQLTQRDLQVSWLSPVHVFESVSLPAAGVSVLPVNPVPLGQLLIVTNLVNTANRGGAATISEQRILLTRPGFAGPLITAARPPAPTRNFLAWTGQLLVPAGWSVQFDADFSVAAAGNEVQGSVSGMLIPIGNVQRI